MAHVEYYGSSESDLSEFSEMELKLLDFINDKIAAGNSLRDIIGFLFEHVQPVIPCDRIGVAFTEENDMRLVLYTVVAGYENLNLAEGYGADIAGSSLREIFLSNTPRIINDLDAYGKDHPSSESTTLLLQEGILSSMTCPLKVDERPVGLLFFSSRERDAYKSRQVAFHLAIAERLGQAVEKAYMIEDLRNSINSYLEMLGFVTHELRSPLHTIITVGRTLQGGYFGQMQEKQTEMVGRIVERAEQLNKTVDDYLNLSRFENNTMDISRRPCSLETDVIRPVLDAIDPLVKASSMKITENVPQGLPEIDCDPDLMRIVLNNLLSNAVKYGKEGGGILLTAHHDGKELSLTVRNEGPGFPKTEKKKLFRKFSRIMTPELKDKKGSGIGLYTSWKIVKLHGGSMKADSREGEWAEFTLSIPQG